MSEIERLLNEAKQKRGSGLKTAAEGAYVSAADLARAKSDLSALAHALRHISDLERERGARFDALGHASEASDLYRGTGERLGLANSLRLQALSAPDVESATAFWREARELYAALDIAAGVMECDRHLAS